MQKPKQLIRSVIISLGKANTGKIKTLKQIALDGCNFIKKYIDIVWHTDTQKFADASLYNQVPSEKYTAKFLQLCAKRALSMVTATHNKQKKREYWKADHIAKNEIDKAAKLDALIQSVWLNGKPKIKTFSLELNENCVKITQKAKSQTKKSKKKEIKHQHWIKLSQILRNVDIPGIPYLPTKLYNYYLRNGWTLCKFLQLTHTGIAKVIFKKEKPAQKTSGIKVGCDIGVNSVWALSSAAISPDYLHGKRIHNLPLIYKRINRTKKGLKRRKKRKKHGINYSNWAINQIKWNKIKEIHVEELKNLPKTNWRYRNILDKIKRKCQELGIKRVSVNPRYTSQRCSQCGWVQESNRNNKLFVCKKCQFECDADINGSINIGFLSQKERISEPDNIQNNISGFYYKQIN